MRVDPTAAAGGPPGSGRLEGWSITAAVAAVVAAGSLAIFAVQGFDEASLRSVIRATARTSALLFALAFGASSLRRLWPTEASAWLLRNRRYIGVGMAVSHLAHLAALVVLGIVFPHPFLDELDAVVLVGGGTAYLLLAAMTVTSFDRSAAWLGRRAWRRLHLTGSWVLWLVFTNAYAGGVAAGAPASLPMLLLLLAVAGLRARVRWQQRVRRAVGAPPVPPSAA